MALTYSATVPPLETYSIGDKITVRGSSRHHGRIATILKVGRRRLTVEFHDDEKGRYVDYRNARPISSDTTPIIVDDTTSPAIDDTTTLTEDKTTSTSDLTAVLEQLAITTATAIRTHEPEHRDKLFRAFIRSLEHHLGDTRHSVNI
jgi:hypothetical protein